MAHDVVQHGGCRWMAVPVLRFLRADYLHIASEMLHTYIHVYISSIIIVIAVAITVSERSVRFEAFAFGGSASGQVPG